ncbi:MAG TPA: sigma-70 family RNA polymerase sigma factor [Polyangiaceae bacterium]
MTHPAVAQPTPVEPPPPSRHRENAELVERMRTDPVGAAPLVYARFAPIVNRLVWRLLGADPDHNDVVQQVFYRILKQVGRVRDPERLDSWVQSIAMNSVYEVLRRRQVRRIFLKDLPTEAHADLVRDVEVRDLLLRTKALIERLSPKDRLAFTLYFVERRTLAEIAELEGYSLATAKRRVMRANLRFQRLISENPDLAGLFKGKAKRT